MKTRIKTFDRGSCGRSNYVPSLFYKRNRHHIAGGEKTMENHTSSINTVFVRCLGWVVFCLGLLLGIFGLGDVILRSLDRRYREMTVYLAFGILVLLCTLGLLYLIARNTQNMHQFLSRACLLLLLSIVIWTFLAGMFMFSYNGEVANDGWFAPKEKILFDDGFLAYTHIVVYDPGNLLWTGQRLPEYEYSD